MRIGSLRPSRYGRTLQNKGLETYFTTTNSECEQIGIKTHNFVLKKKGEQNALEKVRCFGKINLNFNTDMSPWHYSENDSKDKKKQREGK